MESSQEFVLASTSGYFKPEEYQESQVLSLPKGCYSAHMTDLSQSMNSLSGHLRGSSSQPAKPGQRGRDRTMKQVGGEAGSVGVKEQI